jgi:hypothetical protein
VQNRIAAVAAAAFAVAVLGACSTPSQAQLASTATVTVNGNDVRPHVVRCFQQEWYRTIALGDDASGATVVIDQSAHPVTTTSVRFYDFGGFTGTYSPGSGGEANTRFDGETFAITGTANGFNTAKPTEPATAEFKITANC